MVALNTLNRASDIELGGGGLVVKGICMGLGREISLEMILVAACGIFTESRGMFSLRCMDSLVVACGLSSHTQA